LGKYREAEDLSSRSFETMRRVLGPDHFYTLGGMHGLASVYSGEGKYQQAEAIFEQAIVIYRRVLGPDHADTLSTLADSASTYQREGKYDAAESRAAETLTARRRAFGSDNADTMASAADLAMAYQSKQEFVKSEPLAREALAFFRNKQPNDWQGFRAESLVGASLAGQQKYADAEPILLDGYRGMWERRNSMGLPNLYYVNRAGSWITQLYEAWGKPDRAAAWRQAHPDASASR
jgi:tetratricopeptide (TPR) repeat protein